MTPECLNDLREIALAIAPELNDAPLYLLNHPDWLQRPEALAYATYADCAAFRELLTDGPGRVIAFVDHTLNRPKLLAVLCHEVSHLLDPLMLVPRQTRESDSARVDDAKASFSAWARDPEPPQPKPRWALGGHGSAFIRRALHLWWRCNILKFEFPALSGFSGHEYDTSNTQHYFLALGAEPCAMLGATFAQIEATPEPKTFRALFKRDLHIWMAANPEIMKGIKHEDADANA